jgi:two-component system phosphate regulon response regulator PhoB
MIMQIQTILIVDDEAPIRDMITMALESEGFRCIQAANVQEGHIAVIDKKPDLVLLDWMMPGSSGIDLVKRLRKDDVTANLPIIMLTAKTLEDNKIQGLDAGADDYITKPFSPRELISRVKAILRRLGNQTQQGPISFLELVFDAQTHRVAIADKTITLRPVEYKLIEFFLTHQERVYNRDQILSHVWGSNTYMDDRTIDVHIRRLRKALEEDGYDKYIQTVRGAGYRFSVNVTESN